MQIEITHRFQKQLASCTDHRLAKRVIRVIEEVIVAESLNQVKNLKKLSGFDNLYRIRIGSYRLGIMIEKGTVIFAAFEHRSRMYNKFP